MLRPWKARSFLWYLEGSGAEFERTVLGPMDERLRWLIQSPSGTGLRTGLEGVWLRPFWPVEEVRGGMALGERRLSDTIIAVAVERELTLEHRTSGKMSEDAKNLQSSSARAVVVALSR